MKVLMLKSVISGSQWRNEGEVLELDSKTCAHYFKKGIAQEYKEAPVKKEAKPKMETKEAKAPRKRTTKKAQ